MNFSIRILNLVGVRGVKFSSFLFSSLRLCTVLDDGGAIDCGFSTQFSNGTRKTYQSKRRACTLVTAKVIGVFYKQQVYTGKMYRKM